MSDPFIIRPKPSGLGAWPRRVLSGTGLLLVHACGFVGFEAQRGLDAGGEQPPEPDADSGAGHADSGMDGSLASMDASDPDVDAGRDPLDGGDVHARDAADTPLDATARGDAALATDAAPEASVDPDPPATPVSDYCMSVPRLQREPVIDGVVDSQLNIVALMPQGWSTSTPGTPVPAHTTASYALAWLPDGLYAYIRVVDPNRVPPGPSNSLWQGDGVELYFDSDGLFPASPQYDSPGTIQIIIAAPVDATTPSTRSMRFRDGATQTAWMSSRFATFPTPDGYVFEGFVQADALDAASLLLEAGNAVGVDLSINVSAVDEQPDGGLSLDGLRLGQYFLHITEPTHCGGLPFCNSAAFCAPTLVD